MPGTGVTGTIRGRPDGRSRGRRARRLLRESGGLRGAGARGSGATPGRNSVTGPAQFGAERRRRRGRFRWGNRLNLDWRIDATNVLNRVTYSGVNTSSAARSSACRTGRTRCARCRRSLRVRF